MIYPPIIIALVKAGANVEAINTEHDLPLVMAVKSNYNQGAKFLILNGANPLSRDNNNSCALGVALSFKKIEIVEYIYTHPKDKTQLKEFYALNSLYLGTQSQFTPLLKSMELKLSLDNNLPERKNSPKLGKI